MPEKIYIFLNFFIEKFKSSANIDSAHILQHIFLKVFEIDDKQLETSARISRVTSDL
jgi:hypothetical protein